jgi:hypothetical protein
MRAIVQGRWFPQRRHPLRLVAALGLVTLVTLVTLAGCGETTASSGKITYAFHVQELSIPPPDAQRYVHQTIAVSCLPGEFALAGGYNLGSPPMMNDWQAAHPAPGEAQPDTYGLYRPIPKLLRVTASRPHLNDVGRPVGWEIVIDGTVYPGSSTHTVAAYAYCAGGLSTPPKTATKQIITNSTTIQVEAPCLAGTLVSGGGYTATAYTYSGGSAYLPVYSSFLELPPVNTWLVLTEDFSDTFRPYPTASIVANAVCVSTQDFAQVSSVRTADIVVAIDTWTATAVGTDTDYSQQLSGPSPCPAGDFPLPPGYHVDGLSGLSLDLRVDAAWESGTLDTWSVAVSIGGAAAYQANLLSPNQSLVVDVYASCLTPK